MLVDVAVVNAALAAVTEANLRMRALYDDCAQRGADQLALSALEGRRQALVELIEWLSSW